MARKPNGHGHTYRVGSSYRTVIRKGEIVITAMAKTAQKSRSIAKARFANLSQDHFEFSKNPKLSVSDFLLNWLDETHRHQIAYSTYRRYRSLVIHHIIPRLGNVELRKLNSHSITIMLLDMKTNGQSVRSQQQARAILSVSLKFAEEKKFIAVNPIGKVKNPHGTGRVLTPLKIEEVKTLLRVFNGTYQHARLHVSLICGLRQGEALGLRWQNLDFNSGTLTVSSQIQKINGDFKFIGLKTNRSYRSLVLTDETLGSLRRHKVLIEEMKISNSENWIDLDLIFPAKDGSPMSSHIDYNNWQKSLKICGIQARRLHDARHTAATLMYSQGVGIETISRVLGHSSSAVTSRLYVHASDTPLRDAAKKINDVLTLK